MENQKKQPVSLKIKENIAQMEEAYRDCADIKKKPMMLGVSQDVEAYLIYIEVTVDTGTSVLGETLRFLNEKTREGILSSLEKNALAISDATFFSTIEEAIDALCSEYEADRELVTTDVNRFVEVLTRNGFCE